MTAKREMKDFNTHRNTPVQLPIPTIILCKKPAPNCFWYWLFSTSITSSLAVHISSKDNKVVALHSTYPLPKELNSPSERLEKSAAANFGGQSLL